MKCNYSFEAQHCHTGATSGAATNAVALNKGRRQGYLGVLRHPARVDGSGPSEADQRGSLGGGGGGFSDHGSPLM